MFGKRSASENSAVTELETAKMEIMKARFRRVLGESVSSHVIQGLRRKISGCIRTLRIGEAAECSKKVGCCKGAKKKCGSAGRGKNA
jgi:ribosomal protein L29